MSFNALNLNQSADIQSAFLGSAIDAAANNTNQTNGFIALPPKPTNYFPHGDKTNPAMMDILLAQDIERERKQSLAEGSEATRDYRLVKNRKSPTRSEQENLRRLALQTQQNKLQFIADSKETEKRHEEWLAQPVEQQKYAQAPEIREVVCAREHIALIKQRDGALMAVNSETGEVLPKRIGQRGAIARLWHREFDDVYRLRVSAQASASDAPPVQGGERITKALSSRAATKIIDSGAYVSVVRGGFTTFLTPTFTPEIRYRLANDHYFKISNGKKGDVVSDEILAETNYTEIKLVRGRNKKLRYKAVRNVRIGDVIDGGVKASGAFTKVGFGKSTMGQEVSRFLDGMNKMRQRGWQTNNPVLKTNVIHSKHGPIKMDCVGACEKIAAAPLAIEETRVIHSKHGPIKMDCVSKTEKLDYIWVAEAPEAKNGKISVEHSRFGPIKKVEQNPHCHILMRWEVEPHLFYDFAQRIEKLWGNGFAKLERIHNAKAASSYLLKALGYIMKGTNSDQGEIRGNRYNISMPARAPAFECLSEFEAQNMTPIINEIKEKLRRRHAPIKAKIINAQDKLAKYKKAYNIQKSIKGRTQAQRNIALENTRKKIEEHQKTIDDGYQKIKSLGVRADEYQITFSNFDLVKKFITWASHARYWGAEMLSGYLHDYSHVREQRGNLIASARRYQKGLAEKEEMSEILYERQMDDSNFEIESDVISTDEFYNEYYSEWSSAAA